MSKQQDQLRRRLERATAAEFAADELPNAELPDAETASLREGWVALGQLLVAAYPPTEQPLALPSLPRRKTAVWRNPATVAALTASLLVAATLAWSLLSADGPGRGPGAGNRPGSPEAPGPHRFGRPGGPPRWPHHNWDAIEKADPEMYELLKGDHDIEQQTRELAIQYRRAPAEQKPEIKKEIKKLVNEHFQLRQQRRELELKRLDEELKRLREAFEARNDAREVIVGKRVAELLGEREIDF